MITLIAAITNTGAIGRGGKLIVRNKADLKNFQKRTMGKIVIGGRKTFDEIGGPLKGRHNIIITNNLNLLKYGGYASESSIEPTSVAFTDNLIEVLKQVKVKELDAFIIGGESIYKQALDSKLIDACEITRFIENNEKGDAYLPDVKQYGFDLKYSILTPSEGFVEDYHTYK